SQPILEPLTGIASGVDGSDEPVLEPQPGAPAHPRAVSKPCLLPDAMFSGRRERSDVIVIAVSSHEGVTGGQRQGFVHLKIYAGRQQQLLPGRAGIMPPDLSLDVRPPFRFSERMIAEVSDPPVRVMIGRPIRGLRLTPEAPHGEGRRSECESLC